MDIEFNNRRVIQHGQSLFINLPSLWVKNNDIKRRDELKVSWDRETGTLHIQSIQVKE